MAQFQFFCFIITHNIFVLFAAASVIILLTSQTTYLYPWHALPKYVSRKQCHEIWQTDRTYCLHQNGKSPRTNFLSHHQAIQFKLIPKQASMVHHVCSICHRIFARRYCLDRHISKAHPNSASSCIAQESEIEDSADQELDSLGACETSSVTHGNVGHSSNGDDEDHDSGGNAIHQLYDLMQFSSSSLDNGNGGKNVDGSSSFDR